MMKDNFEKYISDKSDQFEIVPENHLWDAIESGLPSKKKRRRLFFWWLFSGILVGVAGFLMMNEHDHTSSKIDSAGEKNNIIIPNEDANKSMPIPAERTTNDNEVFNTNYNERVIASEKILLNPKTNESVIRNNLFIQDNASLILQPDVLPEPVCCDVIAPELSESEIDISSEVAINIFTDVKDSVIVDADSISDSTKDNQTEQTDTIKKLRWAVDVSLYSGYGFHSYVEHTSLGSIATNRTNNSSGVVSFQPGIAIKYQATKELLIGVGAQLNSIRESVRNSAAIYKRDTLLSPSTTVIPAYSIVTYPVSGLIDSAKQANSDIIYKYNYLSIPLSLRYELIHTNKWSVGINVRLAYTILISSDHYEYDFNQEKYIHYTKTDKGFLRTSNVIAGAGMDINYQISKRTGIYAGPEMRKYLYSIYNDNSTLDQDYSDAGIIIGLRYFFR
jgi:hypothetical protein